MLNLTKFNAQDHSLALKNKYHAFILCCS